MWHVCSDFYCKGYRDMCRCGWGIEGIQIVFFLDNGEGITEKILIDGIWGEDVKSF